MPLYGSGLNNGSGTGYASDRNDHATWKIPLLLIGGNKLGVRQGQHFRVNDDRTPMSNLLLTMLLALGIEAKSFSDSTGHISGLWS
jgi:hypothetical protein